LDHSDFETLHARYQQQAEWTQTIRKTILSEIDFKAGDRLLEIGSGTGVITSELSAQFQNCQVIGIDILYPICTFANRQDNQSIYLAGDGLYPPFCSNSFAAVVSHFLLMWVPELDKMIREMVRIALPGGWVLAFAEPDYGGRIDNPKDFEEIGHLQAASLEAEGADPLIGRKLRGAFHRAGLDQIRVGILGAEWTETEDPSDDRPEWQTLIKDISRYLPASRLSALEKADQAARAAGERILFVPTFFAIGRVPIN
jgi:ubiquinone/menaquinone biosynthesis C-methylase UbiE